MESGRTKKEVPKILILDDVMINVAILESIIEEEGYEALCALSVQEAIDIMNESLPQLILSDISMPEMNGLEFCRLLKSNPRTRDIPVVFITVLDSPEEKEQAFLAGAVDFIPKPFERVEVIMRIRSQLNTYRMKQEMENYNRKMHKLVSEQGKAIEKEQRNTLFALAKLMEKREEGSGFKQDNVAYNSRLLAQGLQFLREYEDQITDEFVENIGLASRIRDIGTILIESKADDLEEEKKAEVMKKHTQEGAAILEEIYKERKSARFIEMAIKIARYHHEKWDGTGYPYGRKGIDIPLEARIVALTAAFEGLLSNGRRMDFEYVDACVQEMIKQSGTTFEPAIANVFRKVWKQMKTE